jgi:thymidylate synthase (FAD)
MKATLLAHTQLSDNVSKSDDNMLEDLVAYCARVSNPANQANTKTNGKLLDYLIKHKHWSPFEMASATLEIETTRDIGRQLLRHRSFSFQEFSQRYADVNSLGDAFVIRDARMQDTTNRQNSIDCDAEHSDIIVEWTRRQQAGINLAKENYNWALDNGIAKEQARVVLPEGNTKSVLYANGTIRSWIHYVELRASNGTQKEHMELAVAVAEAIAAIYPKMLSHTE